MIGSHSRGPNQNGDFRIARQVAPLAARRLELGHVDSQAAAFHAAGAGRAEKVKAKAPPAATQELAIRLGGHIRGDPVIERRRLPRQVGTSKRLSPEPRQFHYCVGGGGGATGAARVSLAGAAAFLPVPFGGAGCLRSCSKYCCTYCLNATGTSSRLISPPDSPCDAVLS